jgi:hypothetical protein
VELVVCLVVVGVEDSVGGLKDQCRSHLEWLVSLAITLAVGWCRAREDRKGDCLTSCTNGDALVAFSALCSV